MNEIHDIVSDWLNHHFDDIQPWEEDDIIEDEVWADLDKRLVLHLVSRGYELDGGNKDGQ